MGFRIAPRQLVRVMPVFLRGAHQVLEGRADAMAWIARAHHEVLVVGVAQRQPVLGVEQGEAGPHRLDPVAQTHLAQAARGDVARDEHDAPFAGPALGHLDPATVRGPLLERRAVRGAVAREPLLAEGSPPGPSRHIGEMPAGERSVEDRGIGRAEREVPAPELLDVLAIGCVAQRQPILGVEQGEGVGHRLDAVAQPRLAQLALGDVVLHQHDAALARAPLDDLVPAFRRGLDLERAAIGRAMVRDAHREEPAGVRERPRIGVVAGLQRCGHDVRKGRAQAMARVAAALHHPTVGGIAQHEAVLGIEQREAAAHRLDAVVQAHFGQLARGDVGARKRDAALRGASLDDFDPAPARDRLLEGLAVGGAVAGHAEGDEGLGIVARQRIGIEAARHPAAHQRLEIGAVESRAVGQRIGQAGIGAVAQHEPVLGVEQRETRAHRLDAIAQPLLGPGAGELGLALGGHVAGRAAPGGHAARRIAQRRAADACPSPHPKFVADRIDNVPEGLPRTDPCRETRPVERVLRVAPLGADLVPCASDEGVRREASAMREAAREPREPALRIGFPEPVAGRGQDVGQPGLGRRLRTQRLLQRAIGSPQRPGVLDVLQFDPDAVGQSAHRRLDGARIGQGVARHEGDQAAGPAVAVADRCARVAAGPEFGQHRVVGKQRGDAVADHAGLPGRDVGAGRPGERIARKTQRFACAPGPFALDRGPVRRQQTDDGGLGPQSLAQQRRRARDEVGPGCGAQRLDHARQQPVARPCAERGGGEVDLGAVSDHGLPWRFAMRERGVAQATIERL